MSSPESPVSQSLGGRAPDLFEGTDPPTATQFTLGIKSSVVGKD